MENIISNNVEISNSENVEAKPKKRRLVILAYVLFWIGVTFSILLFLLNIQKKEELYGGFADFCAVLTIIFFVVIPIIATFGLVFCSSDFNGFRNGIFDSFVKHMGVEAIYDDFYLNFIVAISHVVLVLSLLALIIFVLDIRKRKGKVSGLEYFAAIVSFVLIVIFMVILFTRLGEIMDPDKGTIII